MTERVPVIFTNIIDQLTRDKEQIVERFGETSVEDLKWCIGQISKLKYEVQTDKLMSEISGTEGDEDCWNNFLKEIEPRNSYFSGVWLYAECYCYRRLKSIFSQTSLKDFDYFEGSKKLELKNSLSPTARVLKSINDFNATNPNSEHIGEFFQKLLKVNLWGNRNDLSITLGKEIEQNGNNPMIEVENFNKELLTDNTLDILNCLLGDGNRLVDFICDNSGYELLCDFMLADFMVTHKLAEKVRFRVKTIPWFISDVLPSDFKYTISELKGCSDAFLSEAGNRWESFLKTGEFELIEPADNFFTSPYEFHKMKEVAPKLYESLSEPQLLILKGDLNYRKLLSDIKWVPTTNFRESLLGFVPTNLCSLRTVKADLISGLSPGLSEKLYEQEGPSWMITGKFGVIQFAGMRM